jgi:hypothetical protein
MNELTKFLIQELLDTPKTVAIYGGGFKPPTKGHFTVVEKALSDFPEIDEFKIFVGSGVRDGITQEESIKIWELYKPYLSNKINIEPSAAPVKSILGYAKDHPDEKIYWILGTREGNEDDLKDIENRTKSLSKYPNIEVVVINTQGGVSGTNTRTAIRNNDKESFFNLTPDIKEKEQIWNLVSPVIKEIVTDTEVICDNCGWEWKIEDGGDDLYMCHKCGHDNTPKDNQNKAWNLQEGMLSLSKYMIDNGMNIKPLPKVKMIKNNKENADNMLGNTAYYNPTEKSITLFTLNRHPKDILRSFAHEMIHHMQNLENRLNNIQTTNTNEDGDLPELEKEAYEKGNMMLRNWEDSIKNPKPVNEIYFLDSEKHNHPRTIYENLWHTLNEIILNPNNAVDIFGSLSGGKFQVDNIIYVYDIRQVKNPYNDGEQFYNIFFYPEDNKTSFPQGGKENYIKILNTMYKIILDFAEEVEPEYIGISSLDNDENKNYHMVYANLTDNKSNRIPGYFRKDVNLEFNTPQGKGKFVVLKRKDV